MASNEHSRSPLKRTIENVRMCIHSHRIRQSKVGLFISLGSVFQKLVIAIITNRMSLPTKSIQFLEPVARNSSNLSETMFLEGSLEANHEFFVNSTVRRSTQNPVEVGNELFRDSCCAACSAGGGESLVTLLRVDVSKDRCHRQVKHRRELFS